MCVGGGGEWVGYGFGDYVSIIALDLYNANPLYSECIT